MSLVFTKVGVRWDGAVLTESSAFVGQLQLSIEAQALHVEYLRSFNLRQVELENVLPETLDFFSQSGTEILV